MAGVSSRPANVSESEILKIQEDALPGISKKALEFGLKVDRKDIPTFDFRALSGNVLGNHRFHQSKQK